jgi:hypothetical protein
MRRCRIVLADAGSLAKYPQGGGHWSCFLQYLFGLNALGCDVFWLELLQSSGNQECDERRIRRFLHRFRRYGFADRCAVLLYGHDLAEPALGDTRAFGLTKSRVAEIARDADMLWNFACGVREPLLSLFKRRALIDGDPGHLQVSALTQNMDIDKHDVFLTVGTNLRDPDCAVPTLGLNWRPFIQFVYLPIWQVAPDPGPTAPFTSITEWTWEELWMDDRVLSISKRDAYLKYRRLPELSHRPFEIAANIDPEDSTGDREQLQKHCWKLAHPHGVARTPGAYRRYIRRSRAEFLCPKPIHRILQTGWNSDRSACYLASGRPVLMEDTGLGRHLPTGEGLLTFSDIDEAVEKVAAIDADYARHARAARALAEEFMDSRKCLQPMLDACG